MSSKKRKFKTGVLIAIFGFPVFFVSLFYLFGKREVGFDQVLNRRVNSVPSLVQSIEWSSCDGHSKKYTISDKVVVLGFMQSSDKKFFNQWLRIVEAFQNYSNVELMVFTNEMLESDNLECSSENIYRLFEQNIELMEDYDSLNINNQFFLINTSGEIKGIYNGGNKTDVDDVLLETKLLLTKEKNEKR